MLKIQTKKTLLSDFLVAALALDENSIQFRARFQPDEARQFALRCEEHGVTNLQLAKLIDKINLISSRMDFGVSNAGVNPNNGKHFHNFDIGKEYSRVVYVHYAKRSLPSASDAVFARLIAGIHQAANAAGVNEFHVTENTDTMLTLRLWWD